jgi:excisionase family DNA binding protein
VTVTEIYTSVPNEEDVLEVLLTPREAAAVLGVTTRTLNIYADGGRLRCTRTAGGHRRYFASSIRAAHAGRWDDAAKEPVLDDLLPKEKHVIVDEA